MPGGRPSKYREEYCQELIKFLNIKPHFETPVITTLKNGTIKEEIRFVPSDLPLLSTFAVQLGVHRATMFRWGKKHKKFRNALKVAKDCHRRILITNGLKGLYNNTFAIFTATNLIGWRDKTEVDQTVKGGSKIEIKDYAQTGIDTPTKAEDSS